jgi:hypothetical protein
MQTHAYIHTYTHTLIHKHTHTHTHQHPAGDENGGLGIEVCFAEETRISLGEGKARVEVPSRRMAIADLPVFEYAVRVCVCVCFDVLGVCVGVCVFDVC